MTELFVPVGQKPNFNPSNELVPEADSADRIMQAKKDRLQQLLIQGDVDSIPEARKLQQEMVQKRSFRKMILV